MKVLKKIIAALMLLLLLISLLVFFSAQWYFSRYGAVGFDAVLFTLFSDLSHTESGLINDYLWFTLPPTLACFGAAGFLLYFRSRHSLVAEVGIKRKRIFRIYPLRNRVSALLSFLLSVVLIWQAAVLLQAPAWLNGAIHTSTLYEDEYADPNEVSITFPEEKRNLIYIYLESMETTFLSTDLGDAEPYNLLPELYKLAEENINFSENDGVGGFSTISGAWWTIGSMVAQTSGIPLRIPADIDENSYSKYHTEFLPGVVSLNSILHENGYYQALMLGSDADFGGRRSYFTQHGMDRIYDAYTAREDGIVPSDYWEWWGMEDLHLFEYAKQELLKLAELDQPFAFTMLTADTHHIAGYFCELCEDIYPEHYENVISCSDRQVYAFIEWLQEQDFYENTTIILAGDHASMDAGYFSRNISSDYQRHIYNCFLNTAVEPVKAKGREFVAMDMFPTTLAAMGCTIEGDKLGLGVNLFSEQETLLERYGFEGLSNELLMNSNYYDKNFVRS